MASIDLTALAPFKTAEPEELDMGETLGVFALQRINRGGNRFRLQLVTPPIPEEPQGRILAASLRLARKQGAIYTFPQPGLAIGAPGAAKIDGGVAGGNVVPLKDMTPGYSIRFGQFFSTIHSGVHFLCSAAEAAIVDADGKAEVTIDPILRTGFSNNDVVEFVPKIEGFIVGGNSSRHTIMGEPYLAFDPIVIEEAE